MVLLVVVVLLFQRNQLDWNRQRSKSMIAGMQIASVDFMDISSYA